MIQYTYNIKARQYVAPSGRFVPRADVRAALDAVIDAAQAELRAAAMRLQSGEINVAQFWLDASARVKRIQVASGTLAVGGPHGLTPKHLGYIGSQVKAQLAYLYSLAREIEAGLPLDGRFLARVAMYGESGRATYEAIVRKGDVAAGMKWERRLLGGENPCDQCREQADLGWQAVGTLVPLGRCSCLTRCRCSRESAMTKPKADVAGFAAKATASSAKGAKAAPAGHWVTGRDGRHYFITGGGEQLSGPAAYRASKASAKAHGTPHDESHPGVAASRHSIAPRAPRAPLDRARDAFSAAKLGHKAARAAHEKAPTAGTARDLAAARASLASSRADYRAAHPGGAIAPRPLDSRDPRVRALRADRLAGRAKGDRDHPDRARREDAVLLRTPSGLAVEHHLGEAPPKFSAAEAPGAKRVAGKVEKLKPLAPDEDHVAARYVDHRAADMPSSVGRSFLTYDRLTGTHGYHVNDAQLAISPRSAQRIRSGRYDVVKGYGPDGREIPVTPEVVARLKADRRATAKFAAARDERRGDAMTTDRDDTGDDACPDDCGCESCEAVASFAEADTATSSVTPRAAGILGRAVDALALFVASKSGGKGGKGGKASGHWITGHDGRHYFITGSGESLSGAAAYHASKAGGKGKASGKAAHRIDGSAPPGKSGKGGKAAPATAGGTTKGTAGGKGKGKGKAAPKDGESRNAAREQKMLDRHAKATGKAVEKARAMHAEAKANLAAHDARTAKVADKLKGLEARRDAAKAKTQAAKDALAAHEAKAAGKAAPGAKPPATAPHAADPPRRSVRTSAPRSAQEAAILADAKSRGLAAMVVTKRPEYEAHRDAKAGTTAHVVGGRRVATHKKVGDHHVVVVHKEGGGHELTRHASAAAAKAHLESVARSAIHAGTTRTAVVGKDLRRFDHHKAGLSGKHHRTTARVLGDGKSRATFAAGRTPRWLVPVEFDDPGGWPGIEGDGMARFASAADYLDRATARFSAVIPTSHRRAEGGWNIYPDAVIFEAGNYADKAFSLTRAELAAAAAGFRGPVGGNIEHTNYMRGRACQVRSLRVDPANPDILRGEVALPAGFDAELIDEERRLSCEWDRETKELTGLALTLTPRVKKAALVAAFAAHEATAEDVATFAGEPGADPEIIAAFATPRKHDPELTAHMQGLHDKIAAAHPWACGKATGGGAAMFGDKPKQFKAIQQLHNQTTDHGATCPGDGKSKVAPFSGRNPMSATATKKRGMLARLFGLGDDHAAMFNEVVSEATADKWLTDLTRDGAAATGDDAVADAASKVAAQAPAAFSDSPEYKALVEANAALKAQVDKAAADAEARRVADVASFSAARAREVVASDRATPAEFDDIAADFAEAAEADHAARGTDRATVTFSAADGTQATGSRVAKLEARYARRPPLGLLGHASNGAELPEGARVLFSGGKKAEADPAEERRELLSKTPAGRAVLEREDAAKATTK